jgi:hypothetical protein
MARERPADAQSLLADARETFDRLEAIRWLERLDVARASVPAEIVA